MNIGHAQIVGRALIGGGKSSLPCFCLFLTWFPIGIVVGWVREFELRFELKFHSRWGHVKHLGHAKNLGPNS